MQLAKNYCQHLDVFLEKNRNKVGISILALFLLSQTLFFSQTLIVKNYLLNDDSVSFIKHIYSALDFLNGKNTFDHLVEMLPERTILQPIIIAIFAYMFDIADPRFFIFIFWLIFFLPIGLLIFLFAKQSKSYLGYFALLLISADPFLFNLSVYALFTEIPAILFSLMSLYFLIKKEKNINKNFLNVIFSGFFMAMAITFRWYTSLPIFLPFVILYFSLFGEEPIISKTKKICLYLISFLISFLFFYYLLDLYKPIKYSFHLGRNLKETLWAFGPMGFESDISNLYLFRFLEYSKRIGQDFSSTLIVFFLCWILKLCSRRNFYNFGFLGAAYVIFLMLFMQFNPRYMAPVFVIFISIFSLSHYRKSIYSAIVVLIVIFFFLDSIAYSQNLPFAFFNKLRFEITEKFSSDSNIFNKRRLGLYQDWHNPFDQVIEDIFKEKPIFGDSYIRLSGITPFDTRINPNYLSLYANLHRSSDAKRFFISSVKFDSDIYAEENKLENIYLMLISKRYKDLVNSNLLLVTYFDSEDIFSEVKKFPDFYALQYLSEIKFNSNKLSKIGLRYINSYTQKQYMHESAGLYLITNQTLWAGYIDSVFKKFDSYNKIDKTVLVHPAEKVIKNSFIPVIANSFANSIDLVEITNEKYLKIHLKIQPKNFYNRLFVHLLPKSQSSECNFFNLDHDILRYWDFISYVKLDKNKYHLLISCNYSTNVGIRDSTNKNIFYYSDYKVN